MTSAARVSVILLSLVLVLSTFAVSQTARQFPRVTLAGSEVRTLHSASTGRDYDLYVHLPSSYGADATKKYPVLYILDGQWDFKLMDSILGGLVYDKFMPEIIMVGITYSGDNADYNSLRAMDLTPTSVPTVKGSGNAPKFFQFLKTEVIPFVETNYRADTSRRVLQGSSYAGLFTLYSMLTEPGLFSAYVSASPAVSFDNGYAFKMESDYARAHKELPVRLYLAVGGSEDLTEPVKEFMRAVRASHYKGLKLETRVLEGERHASNKPELFNRGLRFVFSE